MLPWEFEYDCAKVEVVAFSGHPRGMKERQGQDLQSGYCKAGEATH